ncbi:MAG TPA: HIT family protein [Eoetvoesiella sp.]|uniref:HIT family protein n=1 Tax=Eoetvoesiella sp. TaxID=1966355 RepID=UPI002BD43A57|nr:HIT family protein [Eoetvoesiella sp.]HWK61045.1 HIT family protein [Eoetvoesiella sp.]
MHSGNCPLCNPENDHDVLWRNDKLRVIDAGEPDFPGFTRVIWNDHIAEMTDLDQQDRQSIMDAVWMVESVMRHELMPVKVNLAQFGNYVPHVHWHVIPRWPLDSRYPDAVWAPARERSFEQQLAWDVFREQQDNLLTSYHATLRDVLDTL